MPSAVMTDHSATPAPTEQQQQQQEEDEWLFSCRCESTKSVSTLLSCLRHVSGDDDSSGNQKKRTKNLIQPVTVFCSPSGLTFHVYGTAKQSQASVDLQAGLFSDFKVSATPPQEQQQQQDWQGGGEFCVNLSTVLECLHVLGTQSLDKTKLSLSYNTSAEIFKLELLEETTGVLSTAAIPGMMPPDHQGSSLALAFRSSPIVARMIVKSEWLKEALQELDVVQGATCVSVILSSNSLELATVGNLGECLVNIPSCAAIVSLECNEGAPQARSYPLHSLRSGMRGLEFAEETCMSMNESGMIAIQHQILDHVGTGAPNFVDFIMSCLLDEDESTAGGRGTQESRPTSRSGIISQASSERPYSLGWDETSIKRQSVSIRASGGASVASKISKIDEEDNEADGSEEEEEDNLPPVEAAPLFGSLATSSLPSRRRRRRVHEAQDGEESDTSKPLLDDQEEEEQTLDVTARATPPRRRRIQEEEDGSSSPELVYK